MELASKTIKLPCCKEENKIIGTNDIPEDSICENVLQGNFATNARIGWFISFGVGGLFIILAIAIIIKCIKYKRNQKNGEEFVTNNPLYGIDYDDYYAETRMEETNPNYDAYYKDDYTSNITDDNELYGQEIQNK